jgi:CBS domain-containing protein
MPIKRIHVSGSGRTEAETVDVWGADDRVGGHCGEIVVTAESDTSVPALLEILLENGAHAAVIVKDGKPEGVVSLTDISRAVSDEKLLLSPEGADLDPTFDAGTHASDVMHAPAVTCEPEEDLHTVSARMSEHNVHQLPVVDEKGEVVGVLRSLDVLRAWSAPPRA